MMQPDRTPVATGEWECMECGYIEEGTEATRPAKCPECNALADAFEFFSFDDEEWEKETEDEDLEDEDFEEDFDEELDESEEEGEDFEDLDEEEFEEYEDER